MFIQACINGARQPGDHPRLPATPAEIAHDVAAVVEAGADAVHVHIKDVAGRDTLDPSTTAQVLGAVRARTPGVSVGLTTGAWTTPDPRARFSAIDSWTSLPDFASVNWHEPGAEEVAASLLELPDAVDKRLVLDQADRMVQAVRSRGVATPLLLHGEGASTWPLLRHAHRLDLQARIGLEDVLHLPDGQPAPDNAALLAKALGLTQPPPR